MFRPVASAYLDLEVVLLSDISSKLNDSSHSLDLSLDDRVKVLGSHLGERQEVNGSDIRVGVRRRRRSGQESLVDGLGGEGGVGRLYISSASFRSQAVTYKSKTESEEGLVKGVEGSSGVLDSSRTLQTSSVESDVPVGQV